MEHALIASLNVAEVALVIGSDLPTLPSEYLVRAAEMLALAERTDELEHCILGPATDGGFYLLGAMRWKVGRLEEIPWSQPTTFAATMRSLVEQGVVPALLPHWSDVDEPEDLRALGAVLLADPSLAPATARYLRGAKQRRKTHAYGI